MIEMFYFSLPLGLMLTSSDKTLLLPITNSELESSTMTSLNDVLIDQLENVCK
jgi:hypothetical protein